ncbi:hypothetical protein DF268_18620 [Streptomyces sp. V2]|uniref:hypothetical protein n=1 Tax=Streptomyces TaxID=1883 RepID=UPI0007C73476|nr:MULTISPECIES: hypothetical protein [Streptomyces]PWG12059.1 hypothetical protein DF268_18620 [Streptomyces sp. V2]
MPQRPASDLPADPRGLALEHRQSRVVSGEGEWGGADEWTVTVRVDRFRNRTAGGDIGELKLIRARKAELFNWQPEDFPEPGVRDALLGIFDMGHGGYRPPFHDHITSTDGDLLVLHSVQLDPAWRGFGLGAILVSEAVWTLADGCSAVADTTFRWGAVGFRLRPAPLGYLLDPRDREALALRELQRREFGGLCEAYRAALPTGRRGL